MAHPPPSRTPPAGPAQDNAAAEATCAQCRVRFPHQLVLCTRFTPSRFCSGACQAAAWCVNVWLERSETVNWRHNKRHAPKYPSHSLAGTPTRLRAGCPTAPARYISMGRRRFSATKRRPHPRPARARAAQLCSKKARSVVTVEGSRATCRFAVAVTRCPFATTRASVRPGACVWRLLDVLTSCMRKVNKRTVYIHFTIVLCYFVCPLLTKLQKDHRTQSRMPCHTKAAPTRRAGAAGSGSGGSRGGRGRCR